MERRAGSTSDILRLLPAWIAICSQRERAEPSHYAAPFDATSRREWGVGLPETIIARNYFKL